MSPKTLITTVLLAFVGASVVYLVAGETGRGSADEAQRAADDEVSSDAAHGSLVTAYYFHGRMRCPTCLSIENDARNVLQAEFRDRFAEGSLRWRSVNIERPENEHFAREYELTGSSLVIVEEKDGRVVRWHNLEQVWDFVGDESRFGAYVIGHARDYLGES